MSKYEDQQSTQGDLQGQMDNQSDVNSTLAQLLLHLVVILTLFFTIKVAQEEKEARENKDQYDECRNVNPNPWTCNEEKKEAIVLARGTLLDKAIEQVTREDAIHSKFKQFQDGYPKDVKTVIDKESFIKIAGFVETRNAARYLKEKLTTNPVEYKSDLIQLIKERLLVFAGAERERYFLKNNPKYFKILTELSREDENKLSKKIDEFINDIRSKVKIIEREFINLWIASDTVDQAVIENTSREFYHLARSPTPVPAAFPNTIPNHSDNNQHDNKNRGFLYKIAPLKLLRKCLDNAEFPQVSSEDFRHYIPE